jgi:hypothetical protein
LYFFGFIKLEVLDAEGKLVDTLPASKRRGINRVAWSMQVKPPRVPRAAQVAFGASQGPRVVPGTYKVRLTKGAQVIETSLRIGLDRRARFSEANRREQYAAVMQAHALFGRMSDLVESIEAARAAAGERAKTTPALKSELDAFALKLEGVKKKIVATKEGGAITGEERIREHMDHLYGALLSWEGKPASYLLERSKVLEHELGDVDAEYAAARKPIDDLLRQRSLPPLPAHAENGSIAAPLKALAAACKHGDWDGCSASPGDADAR